MQRRAWLWLTPLVLYLGFFAWYTDLRGPLREDEIEQFAQQLEAIGFESDRVARVRRFMETDTGRDFLMLNALDFAEDPPAVAGAPENASAEVLMGLYMEHMTRELFARACHPVVMGDAVFPALDLVGIEGAEDWTGGALMRYRSRRAFMEIVTIPETHERHAFKIAALEKTIAYPIETRIHLGDPRWLLLLGGLAVTALADLALFRTRTRS